MLWKTCFPSIIMVGQFPDIFETARYIGNKRRYKSRIIGLNDSSFRCFEIIKFTFIKYKNSDFVIVDATHEVIDSECNIFRTSFFYLVPI